MILIDFSQIAYACTIEYLLATKEKKANLELVRHMILNTLRSHIKKYKNFGEVVVAYDSDSYWRKEKFPHYKANRKKARDKSPFDWQSIYDCIRVLSDEFKIHLPYKVLCVPGTEADDIIGVLTRHQPLGTSVLILSGDKDFQQLQLSLARVTQVSPLTKSSNQEKTPAELVLMDHIIRGDSGDGIPNILSPDDSFVKGVRQKPIQTKKLVEWLTQKPEEFCTSEMLKNYKRNEELIDLRCIPQEIKDRILRAYQEAVPASRTDFFNYLAASGLRELLSSISDF